MRLVPVLARVPLLLALLVLSGCSSSSDEPPAPAPPAESDFAQGTCREAAPDLLALGRTLPELGQDSSVPADVQQSLAEVQVRLRSFAEAADPELADLLPVLVERIGGVRIRAVGGTYEPSLGADLQETYDEVIGACTGG